MQVGMYVCICTYTYACVYIHVIAKLYLLCIILGICPPPPTPLDHFDFLNPSETICRLQKYTTLKATV